MTTPQALSDTEVHDALATLPHWVLAEGALECTVSASSFEQAIAWVVAIADVAEAANHHPDIDIRWRTLLLRLRTHDADAITDLDVAVARRIEAIIDQSKIGS